ncbi:hypothetical protein ACT691_10770 [Vibrio metschnikovii]
MQIPPLPEEESERQKTLDQTGLLNNGSEARFDRITRLAQQIFLSRSHSHLWLTEIVNGLNLVKGLMHSKPQRDFILWPRYFK